MNERTQVAVQILSGMIASTPIVDRTKVDKKEWAKIAVEWADALIEAGLASREPK
jgi:hypothetical protein